MLEIALLPEDLIVDESSLIWCMAEQRKVTQLDYLRRATQGGRPLQGSLVELRAGRGMSCRMAAPEVSQAQCINLHGRTEQLCRVADHACPASSLISAWCPRSKPEEAARAGWHVCTRGPPELVQRCPTPSGDQS